MSGVMATQAGMGFKGFHLCPVCEDQVCETPVCGDCAAFDAMFEARRLSRDRMVQAARAGESLGLAQPGRVDLGVVAAPAEQRTNAQRSNAQTPDAGIAKAQDAGAFGLLLDQWPDRSPVPYTLGEMLLLGAKLAGLLLAGMGAVVLAGMLVWYGLHWIVAAGLWASE